MKLALIGVGQAGGKLVDASLKYDERTAASFGPRSQSILPRPTSVDSHSFPRQTAS